MDVKNGLFGGSGFCGSDGVFESGDGVFESEGGVFDGGVTVRVCTR
jgi:hypothetical protein